MKIGGWKDHEAFLWFAHYHQNMLYLNKKGTKKCLRQSFELGHIAFFQQPGRDSTTCSCGDTGWHCQILAGTNNRFGFLSPIESERIAPDGRFGAGV